MLVEIVGGEQLIAHALVAIDGPILRWLYFGKERMGSRDGAYFLAIARIIELAIEKGVDTIEMGITTYSPKTDFGARMIPLWIFFRIRGPLRSRLIRALLPFVNPVPEPRDRGVFNKEEVF
jgi:hypothetical protein